MVQPAITAIASAMEGEEVLRARVGGMSWVRRRALLALASMIPSLRDMVRAQSLAIKVQLTFVTPLVAEDWDLR